MQPRFVSPDGLLGDENAEKDYTLEEWSRLIPLDVPTWPTFSRNCVFEESTTCSYMRTPNGVTGALSADTSNRRTLIGTPQQFAKLKRR